MISETVMVNAVIVVDMLKGFLEPGYPLYCGIRPADYTSYKRNCLLKSGRRARQFFSSPIATDPTTPSSTHSRPIASPVLPRLRLFPELYEFASSTTFTKQRYSGFFETNLETTLKKIIQRG